jgi:hypothetical protein
MDVEIGAQKKAPAPPMIGLNEGSALLTFYFGQFEQNSFQIGNSTRF